MLLTSPPVSATRSPSRPLRRGFGLLEVLLATALFIAVIGGLISMSRLSFRGSIVSAHRTQAYNLAQDGLEAVRQLRDTAWLSPPAGAAPGVSWKTFPDCAATPTYKTVGNANGLVYSTAIVKTDYEICYYQNSQDATDKHLGIRPAATAYNATATDDNAFVTLVNEAGKIDPNAPLYYKRVIEFEAVPVEPDLNCPGGATDGLRILNLNDTGNITYQTCLETDNAIKVKSIVTWKDFDQDWSVSVSTLLTNWQAK